MTKLNAGAVRACKRKEAIGTVTRSDGSAYDNSVYEARWLIAPVFVLALAFVILGACLS